MSSPEHAHRHEQQPPEVSISEMIEKSRTGLEEVASTHFAEIFPGMRANSTKMILDFSQFPDGLPDYANIQKYFQTVEVTGENPRLPVNRQHFNNRFLQESGKSFLIGGYAENRIEMLQGSQIAAEGRIYHLGLDIFTQGLDILHAPYQGRVVTTGQEAGPHTYGYYVILEHEIGQTRLYSFYGHLNSQLPELGSVFESGQPFAQLGDFPNDENGGWSRHVHVQLARELPPDGMYPKGYARREDLPVDLYRFPDPNLILQLPSENV